MSTKIIKEHHTRANLCKTRPNYRQGRKLTAVKGYTINNESQHLYIYGVPQINLRSELKSLCSKFGKVLNLHIVVDHETEIFTECFHVQYERIQSARIAKRLLDDRSFYGGILHVCYVPEYESIDETRRKLLQRSKDVLSRLLNHNPDEKQIQYCKNKRNKLQPESLIEDIDFYTGDPMVFNSKQIYKESTCKVDLQSDVQNISKNWRIEDSVQSVSNTKHLIPTQILKHKNDTNKCEKRIVFHNKVIKN